MKGYMGKLLRVDLTARQSREEPLDAEAVRDYIGGSGLGVRLAYDEVCRLQGLPCDGDTLWAKWMTIWYRRVSQPGGGESPPNGPMLTVTSRPLNGPVPVFHPYREEWPSHFAQAFRELGLKGDGQAAYVHVHRRLVEAAAFPESRADGTRAHAEPGAHIRCRY